MHEEDSILAGLSVLQSEQIAPLIIAIRHEIDRLDQQMMLMQEQNS